ncbi:hypothetical protein COCNU_08G002810 [Cocos nucifera]|uniref:Uncharacterized protein n=1 Tax=Cocos nucifera TaxID=13894 RepID=A0A8K0IHK7_COCNU|nr:hypothetical protein COCNU_08G002810 [Cocos nucifera]
MVFDLSAKYQFLMASLRVDGKTWHKIASDVPWSNIIVRKTSRWSTRSVVPS